MNKRLKGDNTRAGRPIRHVTLIHRSALGKANTRLSVSFLPTETRRNLLVDNINAEDLFGLIHRIFTVDAVQIRGFEDCAPCAIPGNMVAKARFRAAFEDCAALRVEILTSGSIEVSDRVGVSTGPPTSLRSRR